MPTKFYTPSNWGASLDFEVPPEDILKSRPPALTVEDLQNPDFDLVEIDPPRWAIGVICKLGGRRHEKRCIVPAKWHSAYTPTYPPTGTYGPHGPLAGQGTGDASEDEAFHRALDRRNRKKNRHQANNAESPRKQVPRGNLREEDYRFWKGYVIETATLAVCRWCRFCAHGRGEMQEHASRFYCKERLLATYKYAKLSDRERYCMACKHCTAHMRWGLPLCNSTSCISQWKFGNTDYWHGLVQYRQWALEAQMEGPGQGPFAHLPESNEIARAIEVIRDSGDSGDSHGH